MSEKAKEFEAEILKRGYDFHTRTRFDRREEEYIISKDGLHYVLFGDDIVSTVSIERLLAETEKRMKVLIDRSNKGAQT